MFAALVYSFRDIVCTYFWFPCPLSICGREPKFSQIYELHPKSLSALVNRLSQWQNTWGKQVIRKEGLFWLLVSNSSSLWSLGLVACRPMVRQSMMGKEAGRRKLLTSWLPRGHSLFSPWWLYLTKVLSSPNSTLSQDPFRNVSLWDI